MKNFKTLLLILPLLTLIQCNSSKTDTEIDKDEAGSSQSSANTTLIAPVLLNNKWLYINEKGEKLFDKTFTFGSQFNDGISCVAEDGERMLNSLISAHYYGINTKGERIDKIKSDMPFQFGEGLAFVSQGDRTYLIDTKGNVIKYADGVDGTTPHKEGRAVVYFGDTDIVQIWDKSGKVIKDNLKLTVNQLSEGLSVFQKNHKLGYLDKDGNIVLEATYNEAYDFKEGLARVLDSDDKMYFINKNFEKVLGPFENCRGVSEGIIAVQKSNLWEFIDKDGKPVITEKFSQADSFFEDLAIVIRQDQTVGFINKDGAFTPIDARVAFGFKNGLAIAEKNMKMGFINTKGKWQIPAQYERVNNFTQL